MYKRQFVNFTKQAFNLPPASWLTPSDLCDLEAAAQELLHHLVEDSTSDQFSLLLLMMRDVFNTSQLRAGSHRVRWQMISSDSDVERLKVKYHIPDGSPFTAQRVAQSDASIVSSHEIE